MGSPKVQRCDQCNNMHASELFKDASDDPMGMRALDAGQWHDRYSRICIFCLMPAVSTDYVLLRLCAEDRINAIVRWASQREAEGKEKFDLRFIFNLSDQIKDGRALSPKQDGALNRIIKSFRIDAQLFTIYSEREIRNARAEES